MNKPKVLLTGAGGFIGSNILNDLGNEFDFTIVDDFDKKEKFNFINNAKYSGIYNIKDIDQFLLNEYDIVIHMGAISNTMEQNQKKLDYHNLNYSKKIWNYSTLNKVTLIYASSAATYGNGSKGFKDSHKIVNKLEPLNKYGKSKNDFDKWVLSQERQPDNWFGLKFFNVYGINEDNKENMASVIHWGIPFIKKYKFINLFKSNSIDYLDGEQKRDFLFSGDIIRLAKFLIQNKPSNGIYNVGTGKARSFNDLAKIIFKNLNLKEDIRYIDMPKKLSEKYQNFTEADIKKIKNIGFKNFTSLEDGIKKIISSKTKY